MNALIDKGIIKELNNGNNFEYIVTGFASFIDTDYKVLQSQSNDLFVRCMKIMRNGKTDFCYLADEYKPISTMFSSITSDYAIELATNLLECINNVKNNGFLSCQSIVLDTDKIFVNGNTKKIKLVYIPISERVFETSLDFEEALRTTVCEIFNSVTVERSDKLEGLMANTLDRNIPLELVYQKGREIVPEREANNGEETSQENIRTGGSSKLGCVKLVALNAPYPFEIKISEDDVVIGKKAELSDKVIGFNNAISRRHCRIIKQNGDFYIMDEGSANGTFVNNVRLEPNNRQLINKGDVIRLANSDFRVE
ncbi:MAG: FHA domain-containing protein [Pseudobutyrivibrio sp.]|nr:FHA domain-containing protein [Pseudobutyrivibrio sp.]